MKRQPPPWLHRAPILVALVAILSPSIVAAQVGFEGPPIDYLKAEVHDPIATLAEELASGKKHLEHDSEHGYLKSVLEALTVPLSSQVLVFSKTSLQLHRISPRRPRAIYFNDDTYVGWCQRGDVIEFATTDPMQGAIFYSLSQDPELPPKFERDRGQCLTCHATSRTQNIPGFFVRSVFADSAGQPLLGSGTYTTDATSPFDERWGGWYVTGEHGTMRHMGNQTYTEENNRNASREPGANLTSLEDLVVTEPYLTPHSDLVALMVLEHQTQMHNAIAAANYETRLALHQSYQMNELLGREPGHVSDSAERRINAATEKVIKHLLFYDEFQLTSPISGSSSYSAEFSAQGPHDSQGRSLRQLDLTTRLLKYPCSYLIYSPAFDTLPDMVRSRVVSRLHGILSGEIQDADYEYLPTSTRHEILEILTATKPEFAQWAQNVATP
ncbi:hypothetical protein [Aureliella helgolandensis]|uniref:Cytochrome c domain-containing protein n=1 Tax=Aureliella helgolandensis TaxID=2527968 RepID=A0A518G3J8_9BACT|nr:hypothetical protein [Aureliella helgolandensis]QDV23119.1 hypothetical protein Q31a_14150 [Aureliella helgolandensis]